MNADVLDAEEAAAYLRVSKRHLARMVANGDVPSVLLGHRRVFLRSSLLDWLESREATRARRHA